MKNAFITILLAFIALTVQAKTFKTIKAPEAMACANVFQGELKASEVTMTDTATTIRFTIQYPKGQYFRFVKGSYLKDEEDGDKGILLHKIRDVWIYFQNHIILR